MFLSLQTSSVACILLVNAVAFRPISMLRRKYVLYFSFFLATRSLPNVTHRSTCWQPNSCSAIFEAFYLQLWQLLTSYAVGSIWTNMEHLWNNIDRGKHKNVEKNLSHCCFAHYKFHRKWPGIEPGSQLWEAGGVPTEPDAASPSSSSNSRPFLAPEFPVLSLPALPVYWQCFLNGLHPPTPIIIIPATN